MGKLVIEQRIGFNIKKITFKCKSENRAYEIQAKLPNVKSWKYRSHLDHVRKNYLK